MCNPPDYDYVDDDLVDKMIERFDDYRDERLRQTGLAELTKILPKEQAQLLEDVVVLPIYALVDFVDGSKKGIKEFRKAVDSLILMCAHLRRHLIAIARRNAALEQRLKKAERAGNIMMGVSLALGAILIYFWSR